MSDAMDTRPDEFTIQLLRPATAAAAATTITDIASAITDAVSKPVISDADATCHHPMPSTAGRWTPSLITAGAVATIISDAMTAKSTASATATLLLQHHKVGDGAARSI